MGRVPPMRGTSGLTRRTSFVPTYFVIADIGGTVTDAALRDDAGTACPLTTPTAPDRPSLSGAPWSRLSSGSGSPFPSGGTTDAAVVDPPWRATVRRHDADERTCR